MAPQTCHHVVYLPAVIGVQAPVLHKKQVLKESPSRGQSKARRSRSRSMGSDKSGDDESGNINDT